MTRGEVALVALPGDYGKLRPALIVQSDLLNPTHSSVVVCPLTGHVAEAPDLRVTVEPGAINGLRARSQIMVDKVTTVRRERLRQVVGRLDGETVAAVDRALMLVLGLV